MNMCVKMSNIGEFMVNIQKIHKMYPEITYNMHLDGENCFHNSGQFIKFFKIKLSFHGFHNPQCVEFNKVIGFCQFLT